MQLRVSVGLGLAGPQRVTTAIPQVVSTLRTSGANIVGDLELSREYGYYPGGAATIRVELWATPANAGVACAATQKYVREITITSERHHWHENMTVPGVDTTCGTEVRVVAKIFHLSGNPVAIHNDLQSNGIAILYGTKPAPAA